MLSQVFVTLDGLPKCQLVSFHSDEIDVTALKELISQSEGFHKDVTLDNVYVLVNGQKLGANDRISAGQHVHVCNRIPGGKGGFGSMLRAIGAQIEKTTNREACRDLSGRRLRDIAEEMRLKKWIAKQSEREQEKANRRREKLERRLRAPRHEFRDATYDKQRNEIPDKVNDALMQGLAVSKSGSKRPAQEAKAAPKKPKLWLGVGEDLEDEGSSDGMETSSSSSMSEPEDFNSATAPAPGKSALGEPAPSTSLCREILPGTSTASAGSPEERAEVLAHSTAPNPSDLSVERDSDTTAQDVTIQQAETKDIPVLDLHDFESVEQLESLGLDRLKVELTARGMKCGGTLQQRAERLFSVKGLSADQIKPSLLTKPAGKSKN